VTQVRPFGSRPHRDRYIRVRRGSRVMADRHLGLPVVLGGCARIVRTARTGDGRVRGDDCACNYARDGGPVGASDQSFAHGGPFDGEHFARLGRVVAQPRQPARRPDPL